MATEPMYRLSNLPIEILLRITMRLSTTELCAMRLTCKDIEAALFHSFSFEFFSKKQFMLTDDSLGVLLDISHHAALGPVLRHVVLGLDHFVLPPGVGNALEPEEQFDAVYQMERARQWSLLRTGRAVNLLAAALRRLPGLQVLDIRDFNSPTRIREGPGAEWYSYGSHTLTRQYGRNLWVLRDDNDMATATFTIALAALAEAQRALPSIQVILRNHYRGLHDYGFLLPPALNGKPDTGILAQLRTLHLDVELQERRNGKIGLHLRRFLAEAHGVTWLRLNFQLAPGTVCGLFFKNLFEQENSSALPILANVARLDLGFSRYIFAGTLGDAVARFPSLQTLCLRSIGLQQPPHDWQLSEKNPWSVFLQRLAATTRLCKISVELATARRSNGIVWDATFGGSKVLEYKGRGMNEFLKTAADDSAAMVDDGPESDSPSEEASDDNSEGGDSD